jgi:hypothetical protein
VLLALSYQSDLVLGSRDGGAKEPSRFSGHLLIKVLSAYFEDHDVFIFYFQMSLVPCTPTMTDNINEVESGPFGALLGLEKRRKCARAVWFIRKWGMWRWQEKLVGGKESHYIP